jgi:hypothetical protein
MTISKIPLRIFVGYRLNALFENDIVFIDLSVPSMIYLSIIYLNVELIAEFLIYGLLLTLLLTLLIKMFLDPELRFYIITVIATVAVFILMLFYLRSNAPPNPYCGKGSISGGKNLIIKFVEHHNEPAAGKGYVHIHTYVYLRPTPHGDVFRDKESKICPID